MAARFKVGEWIVTPALNSLERGERTVHLEPKIMQVLVTLAGRPGEMVSKQQVFDRVWPDTFVSDEVLTRSISELRKVFEDNPREATYIQTIPKGGYRLVAPVVGEAANQAGALHGRRKLTLVLAAGVVILAATASLLFLRRPSKTVSLTRISSLAVLPLSNLSGDPNQDYFTDGLTDELTTRLSKISALRVISRSSVMHYKGTKKTTPEIARELNVDALVEGSVLLAGDRVRINVQLIQAPTDRNLWGESYERDLRDVLALQADVAGTIAKEIDVQVKPMEQGRLSAAAAVNPEAHDSYLKGRYYWEKFTEEGMRRAVSYFQQAIQQDPNYAPAYAGLADAYHELAYYEPPKELMPKAKEAALKALQLDETNGDAHAALGWIKWHYDWDWAGAEKEYLRALEVDPGNQEARAMYAAYLEAMGRFEEGFREHKIVLELDPLALIARVNFGDGYALAGRFEEAIEQYNKVLEIDPAFADAHANLAMAYADQGKFQEALVHARKATQLDTDPEFTQTLAYIYAVSGDKKAAREILAQLAHRSESQYVPSVGLAEIYSATGQPEAACKALQRAYDERDSAFAYLKVFPSDPSGLRSNPCFQSILRRLAFPS